MKPWRWWTLHGLVAGATGIALLPAWLLGDQIEQATGGRLKLLGSAGSLWAGEARFGLSDGGRWYALPDPVQWKVRWPGVIEMTHPRLLGPLHLRPGFGSMKVNAGELRMPASWLSTLGAPFNTIRPEGLLAVSWSDLGESPEIAVQVRWLDAQSALASIRPLGEYVMRITAREAGRSGSLELSTVKGPLMMEGKGQWQAGQRMTFSGYASANAESKEALTGLLSQMGRQEAGRYRLGLF